MANACGVDFGTSNSTVGWVRPGQPTLLPLEDGKSTLPSVVFFNADDEQVRYGRAALADYLEGYEGRLMRSLKSLLGTSLMEGQTEVAGRSLPFRQLLGHFIGEVKRRAEREAGRAFDCAVFGRPVYFVDDDPDADRLAEDTLADIARSVGFRDIGFQYEPIAAAFDYESRIGREELVLIADIGGGTSDFSLVRLGPARTSRTDRRDDILATGGVHIGGTDFDKYLSLAAVMPLLGHGSALLSGAAVPSSYYFNLATWHTINQAYTRKSIVQLADLVRDAAEPDKLKRLQRLIDERAGHWLAMRVEEAKIALSDTPEVDLDLDRLAPPEVLRVGRDLFTASIGGMIDSVGATVQRLLDEAGIAPERVDTVFFTGGSSGVASLRERIAATVPDARRVEGDLFGSIGAGLAIDAARKFG
ncbi:Hsp70 family protein [Massilia sp. Root335]|uniref:Hsp70 family protein n=1 Tax=Massilia sp. Root335 TaxID=1736517 RepID=UPI0007010EDC|nr:Hsp70 family protein [Massilia sp. Root335]KQV36756.1 heat-shock protein [Massilia sp. Root335]